MLKRSLVQCSVCYKKRSVFKNSQGYASPFELYRTRRKYVRLLFPKTGDAIKLSKTGDAIKRLSVPDVTRSTKTPQIVPIRTLKDLNHHS